MLASGPLTALDFARELFRSSELYPARISDSGCDLDFARISAEDHRSAGGFFANAYRVPLAPLLELHRRLGQSSQHARYVFTAGYCGSTLITRCLDAMGNCLPVIEPRVLDDWARQYGRSSEAEHRRSWLAALDLLTTLLFRPPDAETAVLVKGGEYVNGMMDELLELPRRSTAIFLYADLRVYLPSILKDAKRRTEFRRLLRFRLQTLGAQRMGLPEVDPDALTDGMAVAYVWLGEAHLYQALLGRCPPGSLKCLDFDRFLANRHVGLARMRDHFELDAVDSTLDEIAEGPLFQHHSKSREGNHPGAYDRHTRRDESLRTWKEYESETSEALSWAEKLLGRELLEALPGDLFDVA